MLARHSKLWAATAVVCFCLGGSGAALAEDATLYDRLGGLAPIAVVVSDFLDALVPDPILNRNPAVNAARDHVPAAYLKYQVTALVCQATGGPCQYRGRTMQDSHAHLKITETEWERMLTIFGEILARHGVPAVETDELVGIVNSTKPDIVVSEWGRKS